jgi:phosphopantothenoylcysteine decarboxylase/phosphopantothenate--cysteine ligase
MNIFQGKRVVLGVTGSIAAYKSVILASRLTQKGVLVDVILTDAGAKLVPAITFETVTGRKAYREEDLWGGGEHVLHIELGEKNDVFLIAPATANTIAKIAHGIADNLLTVCALASRTPLLIAPAMDGGMFANPATQDNLSSLEDRGMKILGPAEGHLASGLKGKGRMLEPLELLAHVGLALSKGGPLAGKRVLVTAGGTQEPIDPVRVITNRSSGKQGYALAQAALDLGADVDLVTASSALADPIGANVHRVTTAQEMNEAVLDVLPEMDVLIMAAAVADYQPEEKAKGKIKKEDQGKLEIRLRPTPDILHAVAEYRSKHGVPDISVGFAAETDHLIENAKEKLSSKKVDLMVANDVTAPDAGFDVNTNRVTLLLKDGRVEELPLLDKREVAFRVLDAVLEMLETS